MFRMWVLEDINYRPGDVDRDGSLTVQDATLIQKFVGKLLTPTPTQHYLSDANCDGAITVRDSTYIQSLIGELS